MGISPLPSCGTCTYWQRDPGTLCGGTCSHRLQPFVNVDQPNVCEHHASNEHLAELCCCCEDGPCDNALEAR